MYRMKNYIALLECMRENNSSELVAFSKMMLVAAS